MKNTIENQCQWLQGLKEGARVIVRNSDTWIRPKWKDNALLIQHAENVFVNIDTGDLAHLSKLADLQRPPRFECRPSIFVK